MTGMRTAFFTFPTRSQSARPPYPWLLVLGWIETASTPQSSAILEISAALTCSSSHPERILTVRGLLTAPLIAVRISFTFPGKRMRSAPAPGPTICFAGHPILMSIASAPADSDLWAASAKISAFEPKSWTETGCSPSSILKNDFPFRNNPSALTISVKAKLQPCSLAICRKGKSVIPDIGARKIG